tara:strand:+ start:798 stop:1163 length:366 start_codon:yes stop_codon:yes gene_type:complete
MESSKKNTNLTGLTIPKYTVVHEHEQQYKIVPIQIAEAAIKLANLNVGLGISSPTYCDSNTINVYVNYNNSTSVEYEVGRILSEEHQGGQDILELYMINKTTATRRKIFILKPTSEIYNFL